MTDDDLAQINGSREQLEGRLQQRYGLAKDLVRKDILCAKTWTIGWMPSPSNRRNRLDRLKKGNQQEASGT